MTDKVEAPFSNGYYYPPAPRPQVTELLKFKRSGILLDIGAGFGNNILPLLEYDFHIVATETNPDCVAGLQKLAGEHPERIEVIESLEALEITTNFDVIPCTMDFHFLKPVDARKAIDKMKSWTNSEGLNIITSYTANNPIEQL